MEREEGAGTDRRPSSQALFQAGELKWGTDEEKFITIFGTRSVSHLRRGECGRRRAGRHLREGPRLIASWGPRGLTSFSSLLL